MTLRPYRSRPHYFSRLGDWEKQEKLPSIIYVTNNLPLPESGGQMREWQLLRHLSGRTCIHLVGIGNALASQEERITDLRCSLASITLLDSCAESDEQFTTRFKSHYSDAAAVVLEELARSVKPILWHVEGCFHLRSLPQINQPIVMATENIEYELEMQRQVFAADETRHSLDESRELEVCAWRRADVCIAVSEDDAAAIRLHSPNVRVVVVPNGYDHISFEPTGRMQPHPYVLYVANYQWAPSRDGAEHLLRDVWPLVMNACPEAHLMLAGAGIDAPLMRVVKETRNVDVVGGFSDFEPLAAGASAVLSPMRYGSGIKMKVIEALAAGSPVIASPVSLRGFPTEVWQACTISEDAKDLAGAITEHIRSRLYLLEPGRRLRRDAVSTLPRWEECALRLQECWFEAVWGQR